MNRIKTTDILDPTIQQPFTGKSLDFLQDSTKNTINAVLQSSIGGPIVPGIPYVLYGVINTDLGANLHSFTDGYIYFNGEIYQFDAQFVTINTAGLCTITVTNDFIADPLTFTDNIPRNVHNVRKIIISDGILGTADFNLEDLYYMDMWEQTQSTSIGAYYDLGHSNTYLSVNSAFGSSTTIVNWNWKINGRTIKLHFEATVDLNAQVSGDAANFTSFRVAVPSLAPSYVGSRSPSYPTTFNGTGYLGIRGNGFKYPGYVTAVQAAGNLNIIIRVIDNGTSPLWVTSGSNDYYDFKGSIEFEADTL